MTSRRRFASPAEGGIIDDEKAPGRQCRGPGRADSSVVIAPAGRDEGTVVDGGRKIDPLSLRRVGANWWYRASLRI